MHEINCDANLATRKIKKFLLNALGKINSLLLHSVAVVGAAVGGAAFAPLQLSPAESPLKHIAL